MKKLTFAALGLLCCTALAVGTTFAATDKPETTTEKVTTAVQEAPAAEQNLEDEEQKCKKKTPQEVRDAVDEIEKKRCQ
jgi:hypothetical protein